MGWFCVQQQQGLDQLSESFTAMQSRITTLQQVTEVTEDQVTKLARELQVSYFVLCCEIKSTTALLFNVILALRGGGGVYHRMMCC